MTGRMTLRILLAACALGVVLWGILDQETRVSRARETETVVALAPTEAPAELVLREAPPPEREAQAPSSSRVPVLALAPPPPRPAKVEEEPAPERYLSGQLLLSDWTPVSGAKLTLELHLYQGGIERDRLADEDTVSGLDGSFRFALDAGASHALLIGVAEDRARLKRWIELPPDRAPLDLGALRFDGGGRVAGVVRFGERGPRAGWMVGVLPRDSVLPRFVPHGTSGTTPLDEDGSFHLEHVPPGSAELYLCHALLGEVSSTEIDVREGQTTRFDFTLPAADPRTQLIVDVLPLPAPTPDDSRAIHGRGSLELEAPPALTAQQVWLLDRSGLRLGPPTIEGRRATFAGVGPGWYEVMVQLEGSDPIVRSGISAGQRVVIAELPKSRGR